MLFEAFGMALGALLLRTGVAIALLLGMVLGVVLLIAGLTYLKGRKPTRIPAKPFALSASSALFCWPER